MQATVFNIQHYSIHDGPGIRTTVFVKGCPLSCRWCQNPESQNRAPQLMTYAQRCTGCGACTSICEHIRIVDGKAVTDRTTCQNCGKCVSACPSGARELAGEELDAAQVLTQILPYKLFLQQSGGGVTVSGGEPMLYPAFLHELYALCHAEGIETAFESSLFAAREAIDTACENVDLVICDLKHMDSATHESWTGVPNEQILDNMIHISCDLHKPMWVRVPVIPGVNDSEENIRATAEFVKTKLGKDVQMQLLPYHSLGASKAESLGTDYAMQNTEPPSDEQMQRLLQICLDVGIETRIGG